MLAHPAAGKKAAVRKKVLSRSEVKVVKPFPASDKNKMSSIFFLNLGAVFVIALSRKNSEIK